jgi:hypothetical protein
MTARAQQVRVALWLSHLYRAEADDIAYAYPRRDGCDLAYAELDNASHAMYAHALQLAGGEVSELEWLAALDDFGNPEALS